MASHLNILCGHIFLAEWIALEPQKYIARLGTAAVAFGVAMNVDKVITRAISLVWLILVGAILFLVGIANKTVGDMALGVIALGAAGYAWWSTRV